MSRPSSDDLDFQSDCIERVLAAHRVPGQVHGGTVTPRWVRYHFAPAPGVRLAAVRHLTEELALALGAPGVRVARDGDHLALEVPRAEAEPVTLRSLRRAVPNAPPFTAYLGLAEDGRPLLIRLASPEVAHVLIAGATGSGKTELLRTILCSLALTHRPDQLQFLLLDPKGRGLGPLASAGHCLAPVVTQAADMAAWLERLVALMERRDRESQAAPRLVIAVDELAEALTLAGRRAEAALTRLAQRGREAGLHVVAATQRPAAAALAPMLKANFPARLVGRVASAEDARVASGRAGTGAERLLGRGDFLAVAAGQVTRFQAACVTPGDYPSAV